MKTYKTQEEVEKDIKDGVLAIEGDVKFECSISIDANIVVTNGDIYARDIKAYNIKAWDIDACDIKAWDIKAWDIDACDIKAREINADNITAHDINARDISYYAFCCVYGGIKCKSIKSRRYNAHKPICLDGKLEIEPETLSGKEVDITIDGKTYKAIIKE